MVAEHSGIRVELLECRQGLRALGVDRVDPLRLASIDEAPCRVDIYRRGHAAALRGRKK